MKVYCCNNWYYRCIYDKHYLINIENNEILCIASPIGLLFDEYLKKDNILDIENWQKTLGISSNDAKKVVNILRERKVIGYEQV